MYIPQLQLSNLQELVAPNKVVLIYGPRRTGKTTLLEHFIQGLSEPHQLVTGDDFFVQQILSSQSIEKLKNFVGERKWLLIDEAQKIPAIGLNLKLIVDHIPDIRVVATGSSSFDLASQVGEPLTGRKWTLKLFPLAQMELAQKENAAQTAARLESRLIYGSYPETVLCEDDQLRQRYLKEIISSYLYKDILELEGLRHSDKLVRLLQLLAFQIGKEVSFTELGSQLGMSKNTVDRYLDLLEKTFVLYRLRGFSRNLRKEVSKNSRYYFYDLGIRNALIQNFNPLNLRTDVGPIWENYLVMERLKKQEYTGLSCLNYFWRTYDKKELDWIEERKGRLFAYEFKWSPSAKAALPKDFLKAYPDAQFERVDPENYLRFIT
ncbi:MAG: ATP-binding protein [Candidatus Omnitrophica bacterium]|nr:ATP-binding protein [Candidatus Omnitrophota bacterium]